MRIARLLVVVAAATLTACSSSSTPRPAPTPSASSWHAPNAGATVQVKIVQDGRIAAEVGELIHFAERSDVVTTVVPADLTAVTFYGDDRTFVALRPGTITFDIPNYDRHFHCPQGPCAHPNEPIRMTLVITPGSGTAPTIPQPIGLAPHATTTSLHVGQQLTLTSGTDVSVTSDGCAGCVADIELAGSRVLVGTQPGTARFELLGSGTTTPLAVHVEP